MKSIAESGENAAAVGLNGSHLTSHCTRKGSTSYVVSLPGLSNVIACWLRAGWQLGGVLPSYLTVEAAGDQTVGRTVCGLPPNGLDFTLLPARFNDEAVIEWADIISNYDSYPTDFQHVIPCLVAAVVHHATWISDNLPGNHPIFLSRCWRAGAQVSLRPYVLAPCRMSCEVTGMVATGIPPLHVFMNQQQNSNTTIISAIENSSRSAAVESRSPLGITDFLVVCQTVRISHNFYFHLFTETRLDRIEILLQESLQAARNLPQRTRSATPPSPIHDTAPEPHLTWTYGGKLHRVPQDFRFQTKISLQVIFQLWHEGIRSQRIGPFKHFGGHDVHKDDRRHLSEAKALVIEITKHLPPDFRDLPSSDKDSAFQVAFDAMADSFIDRDSLTASKRKPQADASYTTLYTKFYLPSKKLRAAATAIE